ncbi:MAG: alpha-xylosidase [Frondihabitans sp.]|nr:alpha-xylosidase [Frondihabitans sp.]
MKFTDGFWLQRPGIEALHAAEAYAWDSDETSITITAPTRVITTRGDTLNRPTITVRLWSPLPGVIGVRITHFAGASRPLGFDLVGARDDHRPEISLSVDEAVLTSGPVRATVTRGTPWNLEFTSDGVPLTSSGHKSVGSIRAATPPADGPLLGDARLSEAERYRPASTYLHEQLNLAVGEHVYGLGERFGPVAKNGQVVDIWNADGGTSSEQAYKNVPFYLSNRGYGVLVNDAGPVSFEVGSENVERVQFSVPGESLEYFVFAGPTPKDVLGRYTALTGRPAMIPAWSFGLWLSTSFTTQYDEATVTSFIDGMAERHLPVSVFHFDCFWMREFTWCDFEWDPRVFPDPQGMLGRLHEKDLHVCVWINPYIAQASSLFAEAAEAGFLLKKPNGDVWQWDLWQAGMALVDFTNPDAVTWFQGKLRRLLDQGVDAFKTDFGERIPLEVDYFDGSDPARMHNLYTQLYNEAVFEVLEEARGKGDAVVFARSATTGGQALPVHWGGDSTSTFTSMAETLRGGLSAAFSGFAFWSHDIGGFEGTPDAAVFKRWTAFGLLSSHSRFHGSDSYRVPWAFDDEAVEVTRIFTNLKMRLMPYLYAAALEASSTGVPLLRPTLLEFPDDPAVAHLDRQYLLGADLLVAPVFNAEGTVDFYLPAGTWTNFFTGHKVEGPGWQRETHGFDSLPFYVREGAVIPVGARDDRPDYDYLDGLTLRLYPPFASDKSIVVTTPEGTVRSFTVTPGAGGPHVASSDGGPVEVTIA